MTRRVFILGYGQVGRATAHLFAGKGWEVTVARRGSTSAPLPTDPGFVQFDRDEPNALAHAIGDGFDAVVDTVAFDPSHAQQWNDVADRIGKLVVISSLSVYVDEKGRSLDEAWSTGPPRFKNPIAETNPRVKPGPQTYSTRKVALEDAVMALDLETAIIRPGAIYGIGSRSPREWWFVQQVLAGRQRIPLAWSGASRFHPIAAENLAEIVWLAAEAGGSHILNAADADCPDVLEIGRAILAAMDASAVMEPFDGPPIGFKGQSPWSIPYPMIADIDAARRIGYKALVNYGEAMPSVCDDLKGRDARIGWRMAFPGLAAYPDGFFLD